MTLQIGDTAPDFEAASTEGTIRLHEWMGDSWAVLFSHPRDFTPVCTTELGAMAALKPEFDRRGVKLLSLSVDPLENHVAWSADIEDTQGHAPNDPMIGDADFAVSKLYGMLPAETEPAMITSSPGFQFTGVATFFDAVSCSESITRSTSSKLRPVLIGYEITSLIFLSGPMT